ncbi:MAG: transcriptional regulator [Leptospiraceae bacterium]|nr:transcriptional regulator [Leptospiraceae bacterium]
MKSKTSTRKSTQRKNSGSENSPPEKEAYVRRARRIEGQVQAISRMIEEERYCVDILMQVRAARSALKSLSIELLESHTNQCVREAFESNNGEKTIQELLEVFKTYS